METVFSPQIMSPNFWIPTLRAMTPISPRLVVKKKQNVMSLTKAAQFSIQSLKSEFSCDTTLSPIYFTSDSKKFQDITLEQVYLKNPKNPTF